MKQIWFVPVLLLTAIFVSGCSLRSPVAQQAQATATPEAISTPIPASELDANYEVEIPPVTTALVPGEVLVKFKPEILPQLPEQKQENIQGLSLGIGGLDQTLQAEGITGLEPLLAEPANALGLSSEALDAQAESLDQIFVASFDASRSSDEVAAALQANDRVEYAEPNFVAFATGGPGKAAPPALTPNDPNFRYQWHLSAIQMEQAWDMSTGANVIVAVVDTGVAYENFSNFVQASDLIGTRFVQGFDFVNNDTHPNDDNGHGTHVAGTIGQTTNNGIGVAGVAYDASIMPVKVLDAAGQGSYSTIIQGIYYAVNNGARVINLSLSGNNDSRSLLDAVNYARVRGVNVVVAAGNNGQGLGYPALYDNTISVGAIRFDRTRSRYSNFGPKLDLVAPGGDTQTDQNGDGFGDGILQQTFRAGEINQFKFYFFEGTSMAAPHVSGVIALLLARRPALTPDQIDSILKSSTQDLGTPGRDDQYGWGLIQAVNALNAIPGNLPTPTPTPINPTPTPTPIPGGPTPTPTATIPPPPPGSNLLINPSFEGTDGWTFKPTIRTGNFTTAQVHSGARSAQVGVVDANATTYSYSSVAQLVTIPANARRVVLTAYVFPVTLDEGGRDLQIVSILDDRFRERRRLSNRLSNSRTWEQLTFDITEFKGQTIYVYFGAVNRQNDGRPTAMYVDDVSLTVEY